MVKHSRNTLSSLLSSHLFTQIVTLLDPGNIKFGENGIELLTAALEKNSVSSYFYISFMFILVYLHRLSEKLTSPMVV